MDRPLRLPLTLSIVAILAALAGPLHAADWPTRPVTVIVPFGAGGNTDMMARLGAQHLTAKLGQTFVVENRPSAGGALGTGQVAAAAPDGYTLLFSASANINADAAGAEAHLRSGQAARADHQRRHRHADHGDQARACRSTTLPEFIAYAKANPGKLNFTVAGTQNISHLAPVLLFARAGIDLVMIPAKGGPQAVSDLMAGQVDLYFGNCVRAAAAHQQRQDQAARRRHGASGSGAAPDIPAVAETLPGFEFSSWNGFSAPAGTPEPIIDRDPERNHGACQIA